MDDQTTRGERFRALHEGEPFVIPNPWDAGSARVLEGLGFAGARDDELGVRVHARAQRRRGDARRAGGARRGARRGHDLPISVDLENGFGPAPERRRDGDRAAPPRPARSAARSRTGIRTGASTTRDHAVERVAAAAEAARSLDFPFTLTARAENHIRGNPDLDDTIARLQAYEAAGADVLYAPGLRERRRDPRGLRRGRASRSTCSRSPDADVRRDRRRGRAARLASAARSRGRA